MFFKKMWDLTKCEMGGASLPPPPKPALPPSLSQAGSNVANQQAGDRKAQGYQSTILTSASSGLPDQNLAKKTLLGQ